MSSSESQGPQDQQDAYNQNYRLFHQLVNTKGWKDFTKTQAYNDKVAPLYLKGHGMTTDDYSSIINTYQSWVGDTNTTNQAHAEYVKLTQDTPGRQATILTDQKLPKATTLLGLPRTDTRTLLG